MAQQTPMMQQYFEIKKEYPDCILFYRIGDFYEMFYEDAKTCSKELELTLTGKSCGEKERAPMCGVPYHAVDNYLGRLVSKGYKVAICEQIGDPKLSKTLVKREVIRVVTPGTNLDANQIDASKNNYLMCILYTTNCYGISVVDVSTGDYFVAEVDDMRKLSDEINRFMPAEIICNDAFFVSGFDLKDLRDRLSISVYNLEPWYYDEGRCEEKLKEHFGILSLDGLGLSDFSIGITAAGAVLQYLYETQKNSLLHLTHIVPYTTNKFMMLDSSTRRNLELEETMREKQKRGSLLGVLDKTKTAMGARMLRSFVTQPLIEKKKIEERLEAVEKFNNSVILREELREYLNPVYDFERLISKISYRSVNARDMIALKSSMSMLPHIRKLLSEFDSGLLHQYYEEMDELSDLYELLEKAIIDEPPLSIRDGGIIKDGYLQEIDTLRSAKHDGKSWLAALEEREREATNIKNLKIKFNKVFGYYLEVTNSYKHLVPADWMRKQTLTGAERYTTSELKELESKILGAEERLYSLEYDTFCQIRDVLEKQISRIQKTARLVACVDVFASLAYVAERNHFVRPSVNEEGRIDIKAGRHPVVEAMVGGDLFVANDTYLDNHEQRVSIITGPNMAGKSTYMRQTALITLMAQIGSFVPAQKADIGICDRIFTRVGASDDLASGQSTFMVEMTEVANILRNATKNSLIILDEIGRGTSTFDGLSIAWAVVEYISNAHILGAKTLFATHYHELTELEGKIRGVHNYCIAVKEQGEDIVFLRKIVRGGANRSYGIQVAKLAGVPDGVLKRAKEIVQELAKNDIADKAHRIADDTKEQNHREAKKEAKEKKVSLDRDEQVIEEAYKVLVAELAEERAQRKTLEDKLSKAAQITAQASEQQKGASCTKKRAQKKKEKGVQLSMFDVGSSACSSSEDIIMELRELNLNMTTPMQALNLLCELQERVRQRW